MNIKLITFLRSLFVPPEAAEVLFPLFTSEIIGIGKWRLRARGSVSFATGQALGLTLQLALGDGLAIADGSLVEAYAGTAEGALTNAAPLDSVTINLTPQAAQPDSAIFSLDSAPGIDIEVTAPGRIVLQGLLANFDPDETVTLSNASFFLEPVPA